MSEIFDLLGQIDIENFSESDLEDIADQMIAAGIGEQVLALADLEEAKRLGQIAGANFNLEGFRAFVRVMTPFETPEHHVEAMEKVFKAIDDGDGIVIEMARGFAKTTYENGLFAAFIIGHHPEWPGLVVRVGDDMANDNGKKIADYIEYNPGWKLCFPHIEPDIDKAWGASGYEVKRTDIPYAEWRKLKASTMDPTFVAVGYKSRALIGKRPKWLIIDDINDENNSSSDRELEKMKTILTGTIFPAANMAEIMLVIGTPWNERDAIHYCLQTGIFQHYKFPAEIEVDGQRVPTWPKMFPLEILDREKKKAGILEYARMFLLDLEVAQGVFLKREWLRYYPYEKIDSTWPVVIGLDYASTQDKLKDGQRDNCAIAVGRAIPGGTGIVLVDGFYGKISQGEVEQKLAGFYEAYPTTEVIGIESVGKGEEFYLLMLRTSNLPVLPVSPGRKSKGDRFEKGMAPHFQFGRALISDVENPFIRAFKDEWVRWPNGAHDDALDAVFWMLYVGLGHLTGNLIADEKERIMQRRSKSKTSQFVQALTGE